MSTSTDLDVWLDEQTIEDMRPPCDSIMPDGSNCPQQAEWASIIGCPDCATRPTLDCDPCHSMLTEMTCYRCGHLIHVIRSDRL